MKRHLTFRDEKSDKFWSIDVNGNSFTVTFGKSGTTGTSQTKTFDTPEKSLAEAEKLMNDKLKKGYSENSGGQPANSAATYVSAGDHHEKWAALIGAKNLSKALSNHFAFLGETAACEKIVNGFFSYAVKASIIDNALEVTFMFASDEVKNITVCYGV